MPIKSSEWYRAQLASIRAKAKECRGGEDEPYWQERHRELYRSLCAQREVAYDPDVFFRLWFAENGNGFSGALGALGLEDQREGERDRN